MRQDKKGVLISWIVIVGLMASITFHYYQGQLLHLGWPHNTFLYLPNDRWNDFLNIFSAVRSKGPYSSPVSVYFPFMYVPLYPLIILKPEMALALLVFAVLAIAANFIQWNLRELPCLSRRFVTTVLVLMSYPVIFCVDRGNLEMLVFIFLALFFLFYSTGRIQISLYFLAGAGAMKVYPLVFVVLFVADHRYREVVITLFLAVLAVLIPAALFPGGLLASMSGLVRNLSLFHDQISRGGAGLAYAGSYFAVIMHIGHMFFKCPFGIIYEYTAVPYLLGCLTLFGCMAFYIARFEKTYWKRLTLLTFAMILFPQVSHDYKLIYVLIPIATFIQDPSLGKRDSFYCWMFGLLLIPKAYYFFFQDAHIGVFINPLLMTLIAWRIIAEGLIARSAKT